MPNLPVCLRRRCNMTHRLFSSHRLLASWVYTQPVIFFIPTWSNSTPISANKSSAHLIDFSSRVLHWTILDGFSPRSANTEAKNFGTCLNSVIEPTLFLYQSWRAGLIGLISRWTFRGYQPSCFHKIKYTRRQSKLFSNFKVSVKIC